MQRKLVYFYYSILCSILATQTIQCFYSDKYSYESSQTAPTRSSKFPISNTQLEALSTVFTKKSTPQPNEWLYEVKDTQQTVEQFIKAKWFAPIQGNNTIYLQPLAFSIEDSEQYLLKLQQFISSYYQLKTVILPQVRVQNLFIISRVNTATHKKQYLTSDILKYLEQLRPSDAFCIVGITSTDLYPQSSIDFVFGETSLTYRVGVMSVARYRETTPQQNNSITNDNTSIYLLKRGCKVLSHEIGHTFGLFHCSLYECIMNGSLTLVESDMKPMHMCPLCLQKLSVSIGFNLLARYDLLTDFYVKSALLDEASSMQKQKKIVLSFNP